MSGLEADQWVRVTCVGPAGHSGFTASRLLRQQSHHPDAGVLARDGARRLQSDQKLHGRMVAVFLHAAAAPPEQRRSGELLDWLEVCSAPEATVFVFCSTSAVFSRRCPTTHNPLPGCSAGRPLVPGTPVTEGKY